MKDNISGYPGYHVTKDGKVYSRHVSGRGCMVSDWHILKQRLKPNGYLHVTLCNQNGRDYFKVHRLVAMVYIPNPNNYPIVMHLDDDKTNNRVSNLQWGTNKMNTQDALNKGRLKTHFKGLFGENNYNSKISDKDRIKLRRLYKKGFTVKYLSLKFNLSRRQIKRITENERPLE